MFPVFNFFVFFSTSHRCQCSDFVSDFCVIGMFKKKKRRSKTLSALNDSVEIRIKR